MKLLEMYTVHVDHCFWPDLRSLPVDHPKMPTCPSMVTFGFDPKPIGTGGLLKYTHQVDVFFKTSAAWSCLELRRRIQQQVI